jgi:hypothetical protein
MAREIMRAKSGEEVDHRNGNTLDNRRENLRRCPHAKNVRNAKMRINGSGFIGVCKLPSGMFRASIGTKAKRFHLGCFKTAEEAAHARDKAAMERYGEFVCLNFKVVGYRWIGDVFPAIETSHTLRVKKGEQHPHAKLTERQVQLIRWIKRLNHTQLAAIYEVSYITISCIRRGNAWKHVGPLKCRPYIRPGVPLAIQLRRLR